MTSTPDRDAADRVGQVVDKYEVVRLIGRGGMGGVYEAIHTTLGKRVALKLIEGDEVGTESFARFKREAQAASSVESPHIIEIFDSGTTQGGDPYLVMELLRGEDLGHRIRKLGRLEVADALAITAQILRGLHRAHEAGIVHRDLKPDNIFLVDRDDQADFVKIVDFGISKVRSRGVDKSTTITQEGTLLGTPLYMSPEQAQTLTDIDERSDLYSVGAILYECLSGRTPQLGSSYEQVIINICMKDADDIRLHNPIVSPELASVLKRALTRDRTLRFQSASELLEALVSASDGVLTARHLSLSTGGSAGARRSADAALRESRPATLAALSTVAAPSAFEAPRRRSIALYAAIGALALGVGAGAAYLSRAPSGSSLAPKAAAAIGGPLAPGSTLPMPSVSTTAASAIADALPTAAASTDGADPVTSAEAPAPSTRAVVRSGVRSGNTTPPPAPSSRNAERKSGWNSPLTLQED